MNKGTKLAMRAKQKFTREQLKVINTPSVTYVESVGVWVCRGKTFAEDFGIVTNKKG